MAIVSNTKLFNEEHPQVSVWHHLLLSPGDLLGRLCGASAGVIDYYSVFLSVACIHMTKNTV